MGDPEGPSATLDPHEGGDPTIAPKTDRGRCPSTASRTLLAPALASEGPHGPPGAFSRLRAARPLHPPGRLPSVLSRLPRPGVPAVPLFGRSPSTALGRRLIGRSPGVTIAPDGADRGPPNGAATHPSWPNRIRPPESHCPAKHAAGTVPITPRDLRHRPPSPCEECAFQTFTRALDQR